MSNTIAAERVACLWCGSPLPRLWPVLRSPLLAGRSPRSGPVCRPCAREMDRCADFLGDRHATRAWLAEIDED